MVKLVQFICPCQKLHSGTRERFLFPGFILLENFELPMATSTVCFSGTERERDPPQWCTVGAYSVRWCTAVVYLCERYLKAVSVCPVPCESVSSLQSLLLNTPTIINLKLQWRWKCREWRRISRFVVCSKLNK